MESKTGEVKYAEPWKAEDDGDWFEEFERESAELELDPPPVKKLMQIVYNV